MIGVVSAQEKAVVAEFFELFKTPWEYCRAGVRYGAVLSTEDLAELPEADLVILSTPGATQWDRSAGILTSPCAANVRMDFSGQMIPIYGAAVSFSGNFRPLAEAADSGRALIFARSSETTAILRIGYDIFLQIKHLLGAGQRREDAGMPVAEIHIDILRQGLLHNRIPFVEIPPRPAGRAFFACLTHDVDFYRIRDHLGDHTFFGFVYRACLGEWLKLLRGRGSLKKMIQNWWALIKLPFVFLGLVPDFWNGFERYPRLEDGPGATYFLIPFKQQRGQRPGGGQAPARRATRYDVADLAGVVPFLEKSGHEIALHGIDAWRSPVAGRCEADRVSHFTRQPVKGVRMHWLYLDDDSLRSLEDAGFAYDSTIGYNDAAGFKSGTAQVYRPWGTRRLLELPMVLQDSAMFYADRMDLSEEDAWHRVTILIEKLKRFGGSLTINWHHRSLGPERLWGEFYEKMLQALKRQGVCFLNARAVVDWFDKRRRTQFKTVHFEPGSLQVALDCPGSPPADFTLHIYHPDFYDPPGDDAPFREIPFSKTMHKTLRLAEMSGNQTVAP